MNNKLRKSTLFRSLLLSFIFFVYNEIFVTDVYKSSTGVVIKEENSNISIDSFGLIPGLSSTDSSLNQLLFYLESEEAIQKFENLISYQDYKYNFLDILRNKKIISSSFSEFYLNTNTFYIDELSGVLVLESTTPNKELSKKASMALLMVANAYFDRQQRINSIIDKYKKMCELAITENKNLIEIDEIASSFSIQEDFLELDSATEMFSEQTKKSLEKCEEIAGMVIDGEDGRANLTIDRINSDNVQALIQGIYFDTVASITQSNSLLVVSEPTTGREAVSKRSLFLSILLFLISYILLISIKVARSLKSDFNF